MPHSTFDLNTTPESKRFEIWKDSISCVFDVEAEKSIRKNGFRATITSHLIGNMFIARTKTLKQQWTRQNKHIARDGMDHFMLQLFENGAMRADHRGNEIFVQKGDVVIFDLSKESSSSTNEFCNLSVVLPREILSPLIKRPDDQHLRVLHANSPGTALLRNHMLTIMNIATSLTLPQASEINSATAYMVASCINMDCNDHPEPFQHNNLANISKIKEIIDTELGNHNLSPEWITRKSNISRTRLYEYFEETGGVAHYIRQRRLRRAMLMLQADRYRTMSINEIALSCGFSNFSAFSRTFKNHFSISPSAARNQMTPATRHYNQCQYTDRRYEHWIHHFY